MRFRFAAMLLATWMILAGLPGAMALEEGVGVTVGDVKLAGRIEGTSFTFGLNIDVTTARPNADLPLVAGDVVLEEVNEPKEGQRASLDVGKKLYALRLANAGAAKVAATFAARAAAVQGGAWHEVAFDLPSARLRAIEIACDRTDLEVQLPGCLRVERKVVDNKLTITALLSPGVPFTARWKPQVQELDAKLAFATESNTIATIATGLMKVDTLIDVQVSQGKLNELTFLVPPGLSLTQVRGDYIRDWKLAAGADAAKPGTLTVNLNRPQTGRYLLQVTGETVLPPLPAQVSVPVVEPQGGSRAGGTVAVGTNSAIQIVLKQTAGLSQISAAAFPHVMMKADEQRAVPAAKAYFFSHAATPFQMAVALTEIVPTVEVLQTVRVMMGLNDMAIIGEVDLEVRDAPIRELSLVVPAGFTVKTAGPIVEDSAVRPAAANAAQIVDIRFRQPLLGKAVVGYKLELGRSPVDAAQAVQGLAVSHAEKPATVKRSFIVVAGEEGLAIEPPVVQGLRAMNTAAVPSRVPNAQFAYSFREPGWSLALTARRKPAAIRVDAFHLITLSETIAYGNVAFTYHITGSPVDEFSFRIPAHLKNPEMVKYKLTQDAVDKTLYRVKLDQKVKDHFNLGMTFSIPYKAGEPFEIGGVHCEGAAVQTQTGYVAVASRLNLEVEPQPTPGSELRPIDRDELPGNYQLLVNAPVISAFSFVRTPHPQRIKVKTFERLDLLPVVIEVTDLATEIFAKENNAAESRTRIRYRIKNSSSQFLPLSMPDDPDLEVWWTDVGTLVQEGDYLVPKLKREPSSYDAQAKLLMVPLPRFANPNDPIIVEVEYGRVHGALGLGGRIDLAAPTTDPKNAVRSTYSTWTVKTPPLWSVHVGDANLQAEPRHPRHGDLAKVMGSVLWSWGWACDSVGDTLAGHGNRHDYGGAIVLGVLLIVGVLVASVVLAISGRSGAVKFGLTLALLLAITGLGMLAASSPRYDEESLKPDDLTQVTLTQTVTMNSGERMFVQAAVLPQWRQYASVFGGVVMPVLGLLLIVLTVWSQFDAKLAGLRPWRIVLLSLGIAGLLFGAAQFTVFVLSIVALFTWVLPAVALLAFLGRTLGPAVVGKPATRAAATAALVALMLLPAAPAQAADGPVIGVSAKQVVFDRVEATLKADADSVETDLLVRVTADEPSRLVLFDQSPILLTPDNPAASLRIEAEGRRYYLVVSKPGTHQAAFKFISPLARSREDQVRQFRFPMPPALTNRVQLTIPAIGQDVHIDRAMRTTTDEANGVTTVKAVLGPSDDLVASWSPRARETSKEKTSFFSHDVAVARFDGSLVEARHLVKFQIAQGELRDIRIRVPEPMTVTTVQGRSLGAWRYDPAKQELEARLSEPATGEYLLLVITQMPREKLPYDAAIAPIVVLDAARHSGVIGLVTTPAVQASIVKAPAAMNIDDFAREAALVLKSFGVTGASGVRQAYRLVKPDDVITATVTEVKPELRAGENGKFIISDERLMYHAQLNVEVSKAGLFYIELRLPAAYEIDTLTAGQVSHWDEAVDAGVRTVQVHFREKTLGIVPLKLQLTQTVAALPKSIAVPRVEVVGVVEHTGVLEIASDRNVRTTIEQRDGLGEPNLQEQAARDPGSHYFRLLKPQWSLSLTTQIIEPRITVDFLHQARISEGIARHKHILIYTMHNAGAKVFDLQLPKAAQSVVIEGADIARWEETQKGAGKYRVELNGKWFDRPYVLTVSYDAKYDLPAGKAGTVLIDSVLAIGADQQDGHVAVLKSEQVQLTLANQSASLQSAEARTIPTIFGVKPDSVASAVYCYSSATADYSLSLTAQRHDAADLLRADVQRTLVQTIVGDNGNTVTRVELELRVGTKQHLGVQLPTGAELWSAVVAEQSVVPSRGTDAAGSPILLVPLGGAASLSSHAKVELVYVAKAPANWSMDRPDLIGPRFDLPLKQMVWQVLAPRQFNYDDFEGTMSINEDLLAQQRILDYGVEAYDQQAHQFNVGNRAKARQAQTESDAALREGNVREAQQKLETANYASAFDEDARVKLHQFNAEKALVGLVNTRDRMRKQAAGGAAAAGMPAVTQDEIRRVKTSLDQRDSDNLATLIEVWTKVQEVAAGEKVQLAVAIPYRGRLLQFERSMQVQPYAPMEVRFDAEPVAPPTRVAARWWAVGLFFGFLVLLAAAPVVAMRWIDAREALRQTRAPKVKAEEEDEGDDDEEDEGDDDDEERDEIEPPVVDEKGGKAKGDAEK